VSRCCIASLCSIFLCFVFFFQAEDGIRDFHVTGVQTCALPICPPIPPCPAPPPIRRRGAPAAAPCPGPRPRGPARSLRAPAHRRSEERRVGKECRSRWSPHH